MRVDAHQHFWKPERGDYGWLSPDNEVLFRDYLPEDLTHHLNQHNIDKTVLVQAAPTPEETDFLLDLFGDHDFIGGVVGWLDMASEDFTKQFARFKGRDGFVGLRPMLQDLEDDRWILRPQVMENLEHLVGLNFPFDILIYPRHLPVIREVLQRLPTLRGVVNHLAKPPIAEATLEPWKTHLAQVAEYDSIYCKLSGMITEADLENWTPADLKPYVHHAVDVFGTDRLMFGSDWPVCRRAGSYSDVIYALETSLPPGLNQSEQEQIFGNNASEFYRLEDS